MALTYFHTHDKNKAQFSCSSLYAVRVQFSSSTLFGGIYLIKMMLLVSSQFRVQTG